MYSFNPAAVPIAPFKGLCGPDLSFCPGILSGVLRILGEGAERAHAFGAPLSQGG